MPMARNRPCIRVAAAMAAVTVPPPVTTASSMQVPTLAPIGPIRGPLEQTVPEPSTVVLAGLALLACVAKARRR